MVVRKVEFESFRNLAGTSVEFCDGINVLRGQNAQGKSNILEGIYMFARGRSFRGAKAKEMIMFGHDTASVSLEFSGEGDKYVTPLEIVLSSDNTHKYFRRGAALRGAREMIGSFRAVLFCPSHLSLAGGAPAVRRSYLDIALSQLSPAYIDDLSRYQRLLVHRNSLLKDAAAGKNVSSAEWESFGMMISTFGAKIAAARLRYIKLAGASVERIFSEMTGGAEVPSMEYVSSYLRTPAAELLLAEAERPIGADADPRIAQEICSLYTDHLERETRLGATHYGIHKDDIEIAINGNDARVYASQGQQRSVALALKLAEGEVSKRISGEYPVFLLDDVLSELDCSRRAYVLSSLTDRQIIITSCDADLFENQPSANVIGVEAGRII